MQNEYQDQQELKFKKNFKKKLRDSRAALNLSRTEAAKIIGVVLSTLQSWESDNNDRVPSAWDTQKIISAYNLSAEDFFSDEATTIIFNNEKITDNKGRPIDPTDFIYVPRYDVKASAGHGSCIQDEEVIHHLAFRKDWLDAYPNLSPKDLVVITVVGDSMEGEIDNDDVILINTADKHLNNGIYVIRINGDLIVKRIQKMPGNQIQVISANKEYESYSIDLNNLPSDFECIGRVVWHGRNII